jgi:hypothetical protein
MFGEFLFIILIILLMVLWQDSSRCYEIAYRYAREICRQNNVNFLDDSLVIRKLWIKRDARGNFRLQRHYGFEFSSDGSQRYQGRINMLGRQTQSFTMDAYKVG